CASRAIGVFVMSEKEDPRSGLDHVLEYAREVHKVPTAREAPEHIAGLVPFVLKRGGSRVLGREAHYENIAVAEVLAELLKASLGPRGSDKLLVDGEGMVYVTNDGATILSKIDFQHPIARIMVELARTVDKSKGDGTTSAVLLACELLKQCRSMLSKKIHPVVIADSYAAAAEKAIALIHSLATDIKPRSRKLLQRVAACALSGTFSAPVKHRIAAVAVDAALQVMDTSDSRPDINLFNVRVEKKTGGGVEDIQLVKGFAVPRELVHPSMPHRVERARIAVATGDIHVRRRGRTSLEHKHILESPEQIRAVFSDGVRYLESIAEKVEFSGANVLMLEKGIDQQAAFFFARRGILVTRRLVIEDIERVAKAVGARVVSFLEDIAPENLGRARTVEVKKIGGEEWTIVEGCRNARCVTVLIRGGTEKVVDEVARGFNDALCAARALIRNPRVVPGGGATEIELAGKLRQWAVAFTGRQQIAAKAYAEALEGIGVTMISNAGLDPFDILPKLRARHASGSAYFTLDALDGRLKDAWTAGILDPLAIKEQVIKAATETAITILRISEFIVAKVLEKEKKYAKMIDEGTSPEHKKKLYKEYKLESLESGM
ncbi:MAG: thermosome subunit alpha, partial [Candidatus Bathyarchaeia archaeon]